MHFFHPEQMVISNIIKVKLVLAVKHYLKRKQAGVNTAAA
jgi:hypothetical protein